jgi:DnaJ-class molecular chaperone
MSKSYYEILELSRDCTQEDVASSYKRLSLKFHPKNSSEEEKAVFEFQFNQIAEAYEVLSDRK